MVNSEAASKEAPSKEAASGRERRRHPRFLCDGFAEVVAFQRDVLFRGQVRDISLTGCFVATRARVNLTRNTEIELRFSAHGQQLSTLARVMDVRPGKGVGVEFVPGDPRMSKRFRDLMEQLTASAMADGEQVSG